MVDKLKRKNLKKIIIIISVIILILMFAIIDTFTGYANISFKEVLLAIFNPKSLPNSTIIIVRKLRLPIAIMAILVGMSLGSSGALMQTVLHNPLASPYTLGIGAGASFGASLGILFGFNDFGIAVLAFVFAMLISSIIYLIGRFTNMTTNKMTLIGIALLFLFQALQSFLQYMASEDQNQQIVFWTFGSLQKADNVKVLILLVAFAVIFPLMIINSWKYNALLMGDEKAESLGIDSNRLKIITFLYISILASLSVCFTGPTGFIGIAGPHMARSIVGDDHRFYLPLSALLGALILSLADILSKLVMKGTIFPIGIITSLIGVPFFVAIIFRGKKQ